MIGNDIVALGAVSNNLEARKDRFLNKLFVPAEQHLIINSPIPEKTVWLLWSMKESAWKAHHHFDGKRLFNPKAFVCQITSGLMTDFSVTGRVEVGGVNYNTHSVLNSKYIHSVAGMNETSIQSFVVKIGEHSPENQSRLLKEQLLSKVAEIHNFNFSDLTLVKNAIGIPKINSNGKLLPITCSLSHHGQFGAYAIRL